MSSEPAAIARFRDAHAALGGAGEIVILPESVHTAALAAAALGCEVGAIANSLLFDTGGSPVLILTSGSHHVDTAADLRADRRQAAQARDTPEFVREHTGQVIGGVSPIGHPSPVPTYLDIQLGEYDVGLGRRRTPGGGVLHDVRRAARDDRREGDRGRLWLRRCRVYPSHGRPPPRVLERLGERRQRLPRRARAGHRRPGEPDRQDPRRPAPLGRAGRGVRHVRHGVRRRQDPLHRLDLGRHLHRDPPHGRRRHGRADGRRRRHPQTAVLGTVGGGTALLSHLVKAGGRLAINTSPSRSPTSAPASPRTSPCWPWCGSRSSTRARRPASPRCCSCSGW